MIQNSDELAVAEQRWADRAEDEASDDDEDDADFEEGEDEGEADEGGAADADVSERVGRESAGGCMARAPRK